jgi:hypothetical protein
VSYYGVIFPEFWTGNTGRQLREHGKDAQLLGLYLATNRHANMLGLYRLMSDDVQYETGLGPKAIVRGYTATTASGYAVFDVASSFVWVRQMARFRLGLKAGEALDPEDKRVVAINRIYQALEPNPFLSDFFDVNVKLLRLKKRRESFGVVVSIDRPYQMSGLPSPLEAPSKPVTETEIRNRDQDQVQKQEQENPPTPLSAKGGRLTRREIQKAEEFRKRAWGGCHHEPKCQTYQECIEAIAWSQKVRVS